MFCERSAAFMQDPSLKMLKILIVEGKYFHFEDRNVGIKVICEKYTDFFSETLFLFINFS